MHTAGDTSPDSFFIMMVTEISNVAKDRTDYQLLPFMNLGHEVRVVYYNLWMHAEGDTRPGSFFILIVRVISNAIRVRNEPQRLSIDLGHQGACNGLEFQDACWG